MLRVSMKSLPKVLTSQLESEQMYDQSTHDGTLPALAMKYGGSSPIAVPAPYKENG